MDKAEEAALMEEMGLIDLHTVHSFRFAFEIQSVRCFPFL